ncbi:MAG: glycosyltransferase 87 family protein [Planctomycetota bacterium]|jgi:hypothetical protein
MLFILLILIGSIIGILVPAGLGWDFANFYDAGRRAAAGQINDLYEPESLIGGEQPQGHMAFWGTPLSVFMYVPLSWFSPESALTIFKIQNTIVYFTAFLVLFIFNRKFVVNSYIKQWRFTAVFVFLCLIYQPFWTVYRVGGQTTPTVLLLFSLALVAHTKARFILSSLLLVIAVMIKPAFITALVFLICVSGLRFFASTVAFLLLTGLTSIVVMGWSINQEFISRMLQGATATYPWYYNSSLYIFIEHLRLLAQSGSDSLLHSALFPLSFIIIKALIVGTFIFIFLKSRTQALSQEAKNHFHFLMGVVFFLLISQTIWEHYLSVLFLLLIYVVASYEKFSRGAITLIGGILFLAIGQNLIFINFLRYQFSFDTIPAILFICLLKSGPLILTLLFLWRHHGELFQSYGSQVWVR